MVDEITPVSQYVGIFHNGRCDWVPRYELSVTHCDVDVHWFPFDSQTCQLIFRTWRIADNWMLNFTVPDHESVDLQTEAWHVTGTCS